MNTNEPTWKPGDRVSLMLPNNDLPWRREVRCPGTVRSADEGGVHVTLDLEINGLRECYATHRELSAETA